MKLNRNSRITLLALTAVALVWLTIAWLLPHNSFWITDGGNKFILIQNLLLTGSTDIAYPASDLDQEAKYFPDGGFHFTVKKGHIQSFYPPYYPWLCAMVMKVFGVGSLFLLSLVFGLVCMWLTLRLARLMELDIPVPLLTAVMALATPFLFYSLVLWEHMFSIAFAAAALLLLLKAAFYSAAEEGKYRRFAAAGVLLAVSAVFREESYILFGAAGLALLCLRLPVKSLAIFGGAWCVAMLPLWVYQYLTTGSLLGSHAQGYQALSGLEQNSGSSAAIISKLSNFYVYLFKFLANAPPPDPMENLLVLPAVFVVLLALFMADGPKKSKWLSRLLQITACFLFILSLQQFFRNNDPIINTLFTQGLLTGVPLLLVLVANARQLWREKPVFRFILLIWLFFTVTICLFLNQGELGLIWGPRHYLVLMPLLVPLAVYSLWRERAQSTQQWYNLLYAGGALLFIISAIIQVHGVKTLFYKKQASAKVVNTLSAIPDPVVVSDIFWLGEDCGAIFFQKKFMQVDNDDELKAVVNLLKQRKIKSFTLVSSMRPNYRRVSNDGIGWLLRNTEPVAQQVIESPCAGFMSVVVTRCNIKQ